MLLIGFALLYSCKKNEPTETNKEQETQGTGHVLGYYIDSTFIGTWQLSGSYIGEFDDVGNSGWSYQSVSYQNRYIDFQQNGLMVSYTLATPGNRSNADTLIYSNSAPAVTPSKLRYFNYQLAIDSNGNSVYEFAYPKSEYIIRSYSDTIILELTSVINTTRVDTIIFVAQ